MPLSLNKLGLVTRQTSYSLHTNNFKITCIESRFASQDEIFVRVSQTQNFFLCIWELKPGQFDMKETNMENSPSKHVAVFNCIYPVRNKVEIVFD